MDGRYRGVDVERGGAEGRTLRTWRETDTRGTARNYVEPGGEEVLLGKSGPLEKERTLRNCGRVIS